MPSIPGLEGLRSVLSNEVAQRALVSLYADSQAECIRNGRCGMEIGMAREKDQGAVLKLFLGDEINLDLDNALPEDYMIGTEKISAKHSQSSVGGTVKAKWTSADMSVQAAIKDMVEAADDYYPNLLLTYLSVPQKRIVFVCITAEDNRQTIKSLGAKAFKVPTGNSRGIEYSLEAMKILMEKAYFRINVEDADLTSGADPIERRMELLKARGFAPSPAAPAPSVQSDSLEAAEQRFLSACMPCSSP